MEASALCQCAHSEYNWLSRLKQRTAVIGQGRLAVTKLAYVCEVIVTYSSSNDDRDTKEKCKGKIMEYFSIEK